MKKKNKTVYIEYKNEMLEHIRKGDLHLLAEMIDIMHPVKMCSVIRLLSAKETNDLISTMDNEQIVLILRFIDEDRRLKEKIIGSIPKERLVNILSNISAQIKKDAFRGLNVSDIEIILQDIPSELRREIRNTLEESDDGILGLMTQDYMKVSDNVSVSEALRMFQEMKHSDYRPNQVYVVDTKERLIGSIDLHMLLITHDQADNVGHIAEECELKINENMNKYEAAKTILKYEFESVPVTDKENRMLGIVTSKHAYRMLEDYKDNQVKSMAGLPTDVKQVVAGGMLKRLWEATSVIIAAVIVGILIQSVSMITSIKEISLILPVTCIVIATSRFYNRQIQMLMNKMSISEITGTGRLISHLKLGIAASIFISIVLGSISLLIDMKWELFLFTSGSLVIAIITGIVTGYILCLSMGKNEKSKIIVLKPGLLSISDLISVISMIGLFYILKI